MNKDFFCYDSPAKLNLFFSLLFKRSDHYHEICSLFQTVNLCDKIFIKLSEKDRFRCSKKSLSHPSNLVWKAVELFRKKTNTAGKVDIFLEKNIPIQAGLGGGSSNAATTLWALNEIEKTKLSIKELQEMGKMLGMDVPFFFSLGTAICRGRGEIVENLVIEKKKFVIAKPDFGVSTKKVYNQVRIKKKKTLSKKILSFYKKGEISFFNDLEEAAFSVQPKLAFIKQELLNIGFEKVVMTGSGSAFFCMGEKQKKIKKIQFYEVETLQRNPHSWYHR